MDRESRNRNRPSPRVCCCDNDHRHVLVSKIPDHFHILSHCEDDFGTVAKMIHDLDDGSYCGKDCPVQSKHASGDVDVKGWLCHGPTLGVIEIRGSIIARSSPYSRYLGTFATSPRTRP